MTVYVFSGLGADERVFSEIDWKENEVYFLPWITPLKNEAISHYARRLSLLIHHENPVLAGISFGGMMAVEVSKHIQTTKVILISSAKTRKEIPWYFKLAGILRLDTIIPASLLKSSNFITYWLFGTQTPQEKSTLRTILHETGPVYLKWAIRQVLIWKNTHVPSGIYHIHGTSDRILPIRYVSCDKAIEGGRHFMILSRPEEVNELLLRAIRGNE